MTARNSAVIQVRIDRTLKQAFADAARRQHTTPAEMLRRLMRGFVREGLLKEAERQSLLVASAPDAEETLNAMMEVQSFLWE